MITKNIFKYLAASLVFCGFAAAFTSCSSEEDPFFTAGEGDEPRILNTNIPEGASGTPAVLMSIDRTQNFEFEVFVTPARYTTVTWFLDGDQIFEGNQIDMPLLAGDHILDIVATTTLGKSTSRTCQLIVRPVEGDPELATDAKSRWLTIGTTKTIKCKNVTSVSKVFIGKTEATNVSFANGKLTFTVPSMEEDDYMVTLEDGTGARYGCNWFTVSNEEYVDPGIKETVIWEGSVDINWGDSNVFLTPDEMAQVPVGAIVQLHYEMIDADYHALRVTNQDWSSDIVPQVDGLNDIPSPYEFTYTADHKAIADAKGMLVTGFGYKLTKVVVVEGAAPAETVLWEGGVDINWGDSNVFLSSEELAKVPVGATVQLHYEMIDAEYHSLRVTNQDWSSDIVPQVDGLNDIPSPYEFEFTAEHKAIADAKGMLITGFGYKLTKVVVVEAVAPAENTLWEGGVDINWGDSNVFVSVEDMAQVPVGATISLYYDMIDAEYHSLRVTNQDWSNDIVPQIDGLNDIPSPYDFTYTADHKAIADEKGMLVTGFGYKLTKITYTK